jgi:hypothetical protein
VTEASRKFRLTHPFHPQFGRELELVDCRHSRGEDWIYFYADAGRLMSVPARWTDLSSPDAFEHVSQGRAHFRTADLVALVELLEEIGHERV